MRCTVRKKRSDPCGHREDAIAHHINPLADMGEDVVENIAPVDPTEHTDYHKEREISSVGPREETGNANS